MPYPLSFLDEWLGQRVTALSFSCFGLTCNEYGLITEGQCFFFYCQIQKANVNNVFDQKNDVNNVPVPMG